MKARLLFAFVGIALWGGPVLSEEAGAPSRGEVAAGLLRAAAYFHDHCAKHGGYDWRYSRDFKLTEGEEETDADTIWVQPPGTPAVGMALLEIYRATGDQRCLDWGVEAARALVHGQMQSGGWYYSISFDPAERKKTGYRENKEFRIDPKKLNKRNLTTLDDDTTCGALRCVMQADAALKFQDKPIHEAAMYCLESMLQAQYPNGGWSQKWDRFAEQPPAPAEFPVEKAVIPTDWSREWLNDWPGRYFTNDNVTGNMIATLIDASELYHDFRYLECAKRTGEFLLRAQLPEPQPGWAQQYDIQMHPCWDRKFEPPAIASDETQEIVAALLQLYRATGNAKFLSPIPPALAYLKRSLLPDGQLARFYELNTNRPLYFDKSYHLTYDPSDVPTHYAFFIPSRISQLETEYNQLRTEGPPKVRETKPSRPAPSRVSKLLQEMDADGAWISQRSMKGHNKASREGVVESEVFVKNASVLSRYLMAIRP